MPTLAQLLTVHGNLLTLDAASSQVQVGLLRPAGGPVWQMAGTEASAGLFAGATECLARANLKLGEVGAFLFCEGPGSMLGVRTVAMALRAWQATDARPRPAYRYQSLPLVAHELVRRGTDAPFAVIADARRDRWHMVEVGAGTQPQSLKRVTTAELAAFPGALWMPREFKHWSKPPRELQTCDYNLADLFAAHADQEFLTATDAPDAFQPDAPSYKKWSPQIHRAATANPR